MIYKFKKGYFVDSGILGINKPSGMTSFDIIRSIKKKINIKKIGHGGTLDPMAEGVLPILMGEATCFFDALLYAPKTYSAIIQLGTFTDTDDKEGQVIQTCPIGDYQLHNILECIQQLTGTFNQIPPQYSALKINGKKAYELAREGKSVNLQSRQVTVYSWENVHYCKKNKTIMADIICGSGTYIRALARDLAKLLNTAGHLIALKRLVAGGIELQKTITLKDLDDNWRKYLISPEEAIDFLPAIQWMGTVEYLRHGKPLLAAFCKNYPTKNGLYRLMFDNKIIALVEYHTNKLKYKKNLANFYMINSL